MTFNGSTLTAPISPSTATTSGATTTRTMASHFADTLNVKDFGAVGDGTTDDTAALQAAITAACTTGAPLNLGSGLNTYKITSTLIAKPQAYAATATYPQFSSGVPFVLIGNGNARIVAGAAMASMLEVTYNGSTSPSATITPYFSKIEGVYFDGNNLATACLKTSQSTSGGGYFTITRSRFYQASVGIDWGCVGIFHIVQNLFQCNTGIYASDKGGDSLIQHNDFYYRANGDKAIYMIGYSGNTEISSNIFNVESVPGTCYAVYADNSTTNNPNRHIRILSNEFYGVVGFKAIGKYTPPTVIDNIYECTVAFNHTTDSYIGGGPGILVDAEYITNLSIVENFGGVFYTASLSPYQIKLTGCTNCVINSNVISGTSSTAVVITSSDWTQVNSNKFTNCGTAGSSEKFVIIDGSYGTQVVGNLVLQQYTTFANTFVYEQNGADGTYYSDNVCNAFVTTPFYKIGANSVNATNLFSTTSTESIVQAAGTSTNLDLQLNPKGTGKVQLGAAATSATTPGSFSASKYMALKDSSGATVYVPVSSTPW
jgi:parallel beta-helix repeat protein